jgi:protoporphyrinogen oxidase
MPGPALVIGAGPAGLAAAYELGRGGLGPVVVEQGGNVGGLSRTEVAGGCRIDIGGHRFYTKIQSVQQAWQQMLGDDFLTVDRLSRIFYRGQFFRYPLELPDTIRKLGLVQSMLVVLSYLRAKLPPAGPQVTFEQWVTNRFGRRLFELFFKAYTEKVWGIPCNVLQADWAAQRIGGLSLASAVREALVGRLFDKKGLRTLADQFHYPRLGPGMMWERYGQEVVRSGGQVWLGSEVVQLDHDGRRIFQVHVRKTDRGRGSAEMERREGSNPQRPMPVEHVISSMPLAELISRLRPSPPQDVLAAAAGLHHRSFLLVSVIVNRREISADNWLYIHEPAVGVGRIQNYKNWSSQMVDDPEKTCLGMEYFCNHGDSLWTMPDAQLQALAQRELCTLGLAKPDEIQPGIVLRERYAYPVYDSHYRAHLDVLRRFLATLENLQVIGRSGMHRYNNQDHSMLTGMLAARNILSTQPGQRHDVWAVNTESSYGEGNGAQ